MTSLLKRAGRHHPRALPILPANATEPLTLMWHPQGLAISHLPKLRPMWTPATRPTPEP